MEVEGSIIKWGNSYGLRLNKTDLEKMNVREKDKVVANIKIKENPLKKMFGAAKNLKSKSTKVILREVRTELDSKLG